MKVNFLAFGLLGLAGASAVLPRDVAVNNDYPTNPDDHGSHGPPGPPGHPTQPHNGYQPHPTKDSYPKQPQGDYQKKPEGDYPKKPEVSYPVKPQGDYQKKPEGDYKKPEGDYPKKPEVGYPVKPQGDYPKKPEGDYQKPEGDYAKRPEVGYPVKPQGHYQKKPEGDYKKPEGDYKKPEGDYAKKPEGEYEHNDYPVKKPDADYPIRRDGYFKNQQDFQNGYSYKNQQGSTSSWKPKTRTPEFFNLRVDERCTVTNGVAEAPADCPLNGYAIRLEGGIFIATPYNQYWDPRLPTFFVDDDTQLYTVSQDPLQVYIDGITGALKYTRIGWLPANAISISFYHTGNNPLGLVDPSPSYLSWPSTQGGSFFGSPWVLCPLGSTQQYQVFINSENFGIGGPAGIARDPGSCISRNLAAVNANPWQQVTTPAVPYPGLPVGYPYPGLPTLPAGTY